MSSQLWNESMGFFVNRLSSPNDTAASDANVALLLQKPSGDLALIAPALLWLFGDAEHLGFYDVTPARLRVAALVKHLWASPGHRDCFRSLARDERAFVTFANGLLQGRKRVIPRRFNVGGLEATPERNASTL